MKNIKVVIGANFGDEGKGLITDYFANQYKDGIVVRFNGGAQAGHTVTTTEGKRHVFGHFGSGSFVGLPTYLSEHFVANPMLFTKEFTELKKYVTPIVYLDNNCMVTTPYDMIINQIAEFARGKAKHGSCGVGFNETITRNFYNGRFALFARDLQDTDTLRATLYAIRDEYINIRLTQLNILDIPENFKEILKNDEIVENYVDDVAFMLMNATVVSVIKLQKFNSIIFEGAQGLLLDQNHKYFPHVTRSNTGIKNVVNILEKAKLEKEPVEIVYATRAYVTRHGAGPFETELPEKPYKNIVDLTNVPNPYQDVLRYGLLDIYTLFDSIETDLKNAKKLNFKKSISVSCLDQLDENIDYYFRGMKIKSSVENFLSELMKTINPYNCYLSFGVTRDTIKAKGRG